MSEEKKKDVTEEAKETKTEETKAETVQEEIIEEAPEKTPETEKEKKEAKKDKKDPKDAQIEDLTDRLRRTMAEFDNFRKRTVKEKEASYGNGKADAVVKLLPIYDNLERALNQPTEDVAYKKGVELTMNELVKIFTSLGVEIFGAPGDSFDPNLHNAVMHTEDESLGENVIAQVFQKGFKVGDKIVRFAMVQVAN